MSPSKTAAAAATKVPPKPRSGTGRKRSDISPERLAALHAGAPSTHLVENLAIDFAVLMEAAFPELEETVIEEMGEAAELGITQRMALAGELLLEQLGETAFEKLLTHGSDTVRGWACYLLARQPKLSLKQRLTRIRPLADDPHFGAREWAWMALRPALAAELDEAISLLVPWTREKSERLRRWACEALRPRGVWCAHIDTLKTQPELGLPILEPLRADPSPYVQDSVANWLNDASKTRPGWVRETCARWLSESLCAATQRICKRAQRSLPPLPRA
ncbi:DNA alkylation repair protein [Cephaloticoccus primus]|uniref:DNA alkylation repair protein n=1 Tax=Cephaloticoccus primus TaxID=1548207 RepID=A0A139SUS4_9BACT|nr:DNA alkylation repair protein [Cephaloticoccus primus]KXU38211.1 DNA alkylation repair protein [Cephaloticoccus primus]